MPVAKPSDLVTWGGTQVKPPAVKSNAGYLPGNLPDAAHWNWITGNIASWLAWLNDIANQTFTSLGVGPWTGRHSFEGGDVFALNGQNVTLRSSMVATDLKTVIDDLGIANLTSSQVGSTLHLTMSSGTIAISGAAATLTTLGLTAGTVSSAVTSNGPWSFSPSVTLDTEPAIKTQTVSVVLDGAGLVLVRPSSGPTANVHKGDAVSGFSTVNSGSGDSIVQVFAKIPLPPGAVVIGVEALLSQTTGSAKTANISMSQAARQDNGAIGADPWLPLVATFAASVSVPNNTGPAAAQWYESTPTIDAGTPMYQCGFAVVAVTLAAGGTADDAMIFGVRVTYQYATKAPAT